MRAREAKREAAELPERELITVSRCRAVMERYERRDSTRHYYNNLNRGGCFGF
jgi:hypothetical protein